MRVWTWPFVAALSGLFLFYGSFYLTLVALPAYLGDRLGSGAVQIGLVTGLFSVGAMLPRPLVGRLADRGGAFAAMLLATGIFMLASVLYLTADALPRLIAVRLLHGTGMACFATASPTLIAAITPPARRAEALGYWGMAITAAIAVFPALGLALAERWGYPVVFAAASLVGALSGVTVLALRQYTAASTPQIPRHLPMSGGLLERRVLVPALAGMALAAGGNVFVSFTVLLAAERHIAQAGGFFAVYAVAICAFRVAGGRLADRHDRWRVAIPGFMCIGAGLVVAALAPSFPVLALAAVLIGVGLGAAQPALMALAVDLVPRERRGAAMGSFWVAWEIGAAASSVLLGGAAQFVTYGGTFALAGAIVLGAAATLAWYAARVSRASRTAT